MKARLSDSPVAGQLNRAPLFAARLSRGWLAPGHDTLRAG
jgi:hypothetical protein